MLFTATWVKRYSIEDENLMLQGSESSSVVNNLSQVQKEKLSHMFSYLLDMDRDDLISKQDFEAFTEVRQSDHSYLHRKQIVYTFFTSRPQNQILSKH